MMPPAFLRSWSVNRTWLRPLLAALLLAAAPAWLMQAVAQQATTSQQAVIDAISRGQDASALLQTVNDRAGGGIATRSTTGKQLAQALTAMSSAVNAGNIDGIKQSYDQVRASAMLAQSDSQELKAKLADPSLPAAFEARRASVQAKLDQLLQQLDAAVANLDGDAAQRADALKTLRETLKAAIPTQTSAPVLRAAVLPVRPLALATRAPATSPAIAPSYEGQQDAGATPQDSAGAPEAPLSDEILAKAQELGYDYVRIYEYVRNNVRSQWYTGSVKGALGTLRTGAGNAVDQSSLLIALLRAAGAPARYVQGVAEISVETIASAAGLGDSSLVPDMLTKAGIAYTPVVQGGRVALVRIEHTWVAVQVPYTNYRGVVLDTTGKTWLPLDVFYKTLQPASGSATMTSLGLDWQTLLAQYRSAPQDQDFGAYLRARVDAALQAQSPASSYDSATAPAPIQAQTLGLLPNTLAFATVAVTAESATLPDAVQSTARIRIFDDAAGAGNAGLDITLPVHELFNQRATIDYIPAELADHRAILLAGGLDLAPVYLFQLRPELRLDGFQRSIGLTPLTGGSTVKFRLDIQTPAASQSIEQSFLVGAYHAIGVGQSGVARSPTQSPSDSEYDAARLLDGIVQRYETQWSAFESGAATFGGAAIVHPAPSVTIVSNALNVYSVNAVPYTLEWKGVTIDAAAHATEVTAASAASARGLLAATGLTGSSMEHSVFESQFGVQSISADKLIAQARAQNVSVLTLTSANASQLATLPLSDASRADIQSYLQLGYSVEIPAQAVALNAWSGMGWIVSDPATGASGYYLSGGIAGGASTEDPWTNQFLADALAAAHTDEPDNDPSSGASVEVLNQDVELQGTVGQPLAQPLSVRVRDSNGQPVKGASVTFLSTSGGGSVNPVSATTNALGVATTTLTLGKSTASAPIYVMRNSADTYPTQAGLNIFDVTVASAIGTLKPDSPIQASALPDIPATLATKQIAEGSATPGVSTTNSTYSIQVLDKYSNPVANVNVKGTGLAASANCDPPVTPTPATVDGPYDSDTQGVVFLKITPGPTNNTVSPVQVSAGDLSATIQVSVTAACGATPFVSSLVRVYIDKDGQTAAATGLGKRYEDPFRLQLQQERASVGWNSSHVCVYLGTRAFEPVTSATATLQVSAGGSSLGIAASGASAWESYVLTGPAPAKNELVWHASGAYTFDQMSTNGSTVCTSAPVQLPLDMSAPGSAVFGVRASIGAITSVTSDAGVDPNRLYLTDGGLNVYPIDIPFTLEPADYKAPAVQMRVFEGDQLIDVRPSASVQQQGKVQIERGNRFDIAKTYQTDAYISDSIISDKKDLPFKQRIVTSYDQQLRLERDVDVANDRYCALGSAFNFTLSQAAKITLEATALSDNDNPTPTGSPVRLIDAQDYPAGPNSFALVPDALQPTRNGYVFTLTAVADKDGSIETNPGQIISKLLLNDALPVGNILVNGVNAKSGRIVLSGMGIGVAARGPQLAFRPAYSSGGSGAVGVLGINWSHNFDASLSTTACGDILINAGDGGFVRFLPGTGGALIPAKGYHGTLIANGGDHSYDFYSKDGTRYHFGFIGGKRQWALQTITDANGNALTLTYDTGTDAPLVRVSNAYGQNLQFTYQSRAFTGAGVVQNVLQSVQGPDGIGLAFDYDERGNLIKIARIDAPDASETYSYSDNSGPQGVANLMLGYTNALGHTTQFNYNSGPVIRTFGNGTIPSFETTVTSVTTADGATTAFAYNANPDAPATDVTDALGAVTSYTFNKYGNPLSIAAPAGTTAMTWATDDVLMLSKTDANGVTASYTYDANGNQTSEQVGGATSTQTWLAQTAPPYVKNKRLSATDRNGHTSTASYDARGNLTGEQMPDGSQLSYAVAANGDRLSSTDGNGNTTTYHYDARGMRSAVNDAAGGTTLITNDNRGRQISITDAEGRTTQFQYNTLDQLTQITQPGATGQRATTWDALGNKLSETDEEGHTTRYAYDAMNRVVSKTVPTGAAIVTTYNLLGSKTSETNLRGNATSYTYDAANRLTTRTEPATPPKVTQYAYDGVGNITAETDANGNVTRYSYNALNQRTATQYPDGTTSQATWDGMGNKLSETDPLGRVTTYSYDALNRLTSQTIAAGSTRRMAYDANGNLITRTDANNNKTTYTYDPLNRVTRETDALGRATDTDYDKVGNKLQITDPLRHAQKWQYNARNWPIAAQDGEGNTTTTSYDKTGNKLTETWPNGNTVRYQYDALGRLTNTSDNLGQLSASQYDADGNITVQTDGNGNVTTSTWDAIGRQLSRSQSTAAGAATTRTAYDAAGNPVQVTDPNGNTVTTEYDSRNRPTKVSDSAGAIRSTTYDAAGNPLTETDGRGRTLTYTYNDYNLRTSAKDSLGQTSSAAYDAHGNKTSETDANGNTTSYSYDALNRVVTTTRAGIQTGKTEYDEAGHVQFETDALGNKVGYEYDKRGLLVKTNRNLGAIDLLTRDAMGDVTTATDPEGRATTTQYDARRRAVAVTDGMGNTTQNTYDGAGNLTQVKAPNGAITTYTYDAANRLINIEQSGQAKREYDLNGNLVKQTDLNGHATAYAYDARNRRTQKTLPGGATETNAYDGAGGLISHQDANGNKFTHTLDTRGQRTQIVATPASANSLGSITQTTYTYDANGNLTSTAQTDSQGARTETTTWDVFNRPVKVTDAWGNSLTHGYDAQGNRTATTASPGGALTSYAYDSLNRLTAQTGAGGTTRISYDRSGKITKITYPDNSSQSTTYDAAGRVQIETASTQLNAGAGNTIASTAYTYDANGNRIQSERTESLSPDSRSASLSAALPGGASSDGYSRTRTESWTYDSYDRLISHTTPERTETWELDAGGRRTKQTVVATAGATGPPAAANPLEAATQPQGTLTYSYNERDQLTQISGAQSATYTYDANGNRASQITGAQTITYRWNAQDQLVRVEQGGQPVAAYRYNADNLRAEKLLADTGMANAMQASVATATPISYERTQWDGLHARRSFEVDDGNNQTLRSDTDAAILGENDAPLLFTRTTYANGVGSSSGTTQLITDSNGNLTATVVDEGSTAKADSFLLYSPYGLIDSQASGNTGTGLRSNANTFGSYYADPETGLLYARARYFDPVAGQFISRDPVEGEDNLPITWGAYQYARYNPYSFTDPSGQIVGTVGGAITGFFWGFGQMIGAMGNDLLNDTSHGTGDYLSIWGQNIAGGTAAGASFDTAVLTGGLGFAASGALGNAGAGMLTTGGQAKEWGQFAKDAGTDALIGGAGGAVLGKALPVLAKTGTGQWLGAQAEKLAASGAGQKAIGAIEGAGAWLDREITSTLANSPTVRIASQVAQKAEPVVQATRAASMEAATPPMRPEISRATPEMVREGAAGPAATGELQSTVSTARAAPSGAVAEGGINAANRGLATGDVYSPQFVGPVQWEYFYRGDSALRSEFLSSMTQMKGQQATENFLGSRSTGALGDILAEHGVSSATSPFVSTSRNLAVAEYFARGPLQTQKGIVTTFRVEAREAAALRDQGRLVPNFENPMSFFEPNPAIGLPEAEFLFGAGINSRYIYQQVPVKGIR